MSKHPTQKILDYAKKHGATSADALHIESSSTELSVLNGVMDEAEQSVSSGIGLRVIVNGCQAVAHTSNLDDTGLNRLAEETVAMAKAMPKAKFAYVNENWTKNIPDLQLEGDVTSIEELKEYALKTEAAGRDHKDILKSDGASASYGHSIITLSTSTGFHHSYNKGSTSFGCTMLAGTEQAKERDFKYTSARYKEDLKAPDYIGQEAVRKAHARVGSTTMNLGQVPVIFHRDIAGRLIAEMLGAINGDSIVRGVSFLKDKRGEQIFPKNITIMDDPHMLRGFGSRPVDAEGTETKAMHLIENGVLRTWVTDLRTAHVLGEKSTGHAARGLSSLPSPSTSNVYMNAGAVTVDGLMSDIKKGFYVTGLKGRGGEIATGDYSVGAHGFLIENGIITKPLHNITLAGNVLDMFKTVVAADDLEFTSSLTCPTLRVEGLTVAG